MSLIGRIESLQHKHADLEEKIHKEETRPLPDESSLVQLKSEKLRIKDELDRLVSQQPNN